MAEKKDNNKTDDVSDKRECAGWVPASERLPEYMTGVLVYAPETHNVYCCYYYFYSGSNAKNEEPIWAFFDNDSNIIDVGEEITHWMRCPVTPTTCITMKEQNKMSDKPKRGVATDRVDALVSWINAPSASSFLGIIEPRWKSVIIDYALFGGCLFATFMAVAVIVVLIMGS